MSERVFCALTIDGVPLSGRVIETEVAGVDVSHDHLTGLELHYGSATGERRTTGTAIRLGRAQIAPVRLLKPTDQTTPELYRAHVQNRIVAGVFKMFNIDPVTGETVQIFSLTMTEARIASIVSSALDPAVGAHRPGFVDWVEFMPRSLTYSDLINSVEFEQGA